MESLLALRVACRDDGSEFECLNSSGGSPVELAQAKVLRINSSGQEFDLSSPTSFESADPQLGKIDLKTIVNCWLTRELSVAEYIKASDNLGIPNLKFLERTDLLEWLAGSSDESEYIHGRAPSVGAEDVDVEMVDKAPASKVDREPLVNHRTVLHGKKALDFSGVAAISHKHIVTEFRQAGPASLHKSSSHGSNFNSSSASGSGAASLPPLKPAKGKDPIILLSPSPSSLLNLANIQDFLESGVFKPVLKSSASSNLLRIVRHSKIIGSKVRFVVVDSSEQFKPEYWNRVVAVFVTGQAWQFRSYRWTDPNQLFHNVLGFGLVYKNDPVPEAMKQWNVKIEPIDRTARFKDREVVERIWERIEAHMIRRGWPVSNTNK